MDSSQTIGSWTFWCIDGHGVVYCDPGGFCVVDDDTLEYFLTTEYVARFDPVERRIYLSDKEGSDVGDWGYIILESTYYNTPPRAAVTVVARNRTPFDLRINNLRWEAPDQKRKKGRQPVHRSRTPPSRQSFRALVTSTGHPLAKTFLKTWIAND